MTKEQMSQMNNQNIGKISTLALNDNIPVGTSSGQSKPITLKIANNQINFVNKKDSMPM